jgi:hypothetical protein
MFMTGYATTDYAWSRALDQLPADQRDIFQEPEYHALWGLPRFCLTIEEGGETAVLPFLKDADGRAFSPYGFGGPAGSPRLFPRLMENFNFLGSRADRFMFVLNPFLVEQQRSAFPGARYVKDVVWGDLTQPEQLRKGHAAAARRAEREGARVIEWDCDQTHAVTDFAAMYAVTMDRLNAAPRWRFGPAFWSGLARMPGASIFLAYPGSVIKAQAGCLILQGHGRAYYHLAASYAPGLNHLMVLRAMRAARARGCHTFCLGGGLTPAPYDPLLRFKAGFSPLRAPVWVAEGPLAASASAAA